MTADIVTAAVRVLNADSVLVGMLGDDQDVAGAVFGSWIFQRELFVDVEGTGKSAIVVSSHNTWSGGDRFHRAQYPILQLEIYSDVVRDAEGNPGPFSAEGTARLIFERADLLFHYPTGAQIMWSDLRIVSSVRRSGLDVVDVPMKDGVSRGTATYEVMF